MSWEPYHFYTSLSFMFTFHSISSSQEEKNTAFWEKVHLQNDSIVPAALTPLIAHSMLSVLTAAVHARARVQDCIWEGECRCSRLGERRMLSRDLSPFSQPMPALRCSLWGWLCLLSVPPGQGSLWCLEYHQHNSFYPLKALCSSFQISKCGEWLG